MGWNVKPALVGATSCVAIAIVLLGLVLPARAQIPKIQASPQLSLCNGTQLVINSTVTLNGSLLNEPLKAGQCSVLSLPPGLSKALTISGTDAAGRTYNSLSLTSNGGQQRVRFVNGACASGPDLCISPKP